MASTLARAERMARAVMDVEAAMQEVAAAQGVEAPPLPSHRDPAAGQAMRLEAMATFLRTLAAEPEKTAGKSGKRKE